MSQVSPDIKTLVDKGFTCWNTGEIDLMVDDYADDAVVDTTTAVPDGRCYKGREEFARYFHDLWDAWERLRMEPLDVVEVGGGRFLVEVRLTGTGRSSGIEIDQRAGFLYTLHERDRKVARVQTFPSKDAALEAAGLSEKAMSQENVELMRRTFERWNAGEREADPEILDPEVVIHSAMTHATYHGYEGLRRWMAEIDHQFDDWNVSIDEFRDASEGRLLALGTVHVRGRTSGVAFDQPMALLLAFAGEKLIELRTIPDHAQALKAAGLSE